MFENSLHIIDACGLTYLHVFPFSPRQGTPAARMPQVHKPVIKARAGKLREKGRNVLASYLGAQHGRVVDALIENDGKGRTPQFAEVEFSGPRLLAGQVVRARVLQAHATRLAGEVCA